MLSAYNVSACLTKTRRSKVWIILSSYIIWILCCNNQVMLAWVAIWEGKYFVDQIRGEQKAGASSSYCGKGKKRNVVKPNHGWNPVHRETNSFALEKVREGHVQMWGKATGKCCYCTSVNTVCASLLKNGWRINSWRTQGQDLKYWLWRRTKISEDWWRLTSEPRPKLSLRPMEMAIWGVTEMPLQSNKKREFCCKYATKGRN